MRDYKQMLSGQGEDAIGKGRSEDMGDLSRSGSSHRGLGGKEAGGHRGGGPGKAWR